MEFRENSFENGVSNLWGKKVYVLLEKRSKTKNN